MARINYGGLCAGGPRKPEDLTFSFNVTTLA